jgi:hypothetical protein
MNFDTLYGVNEELSKQMILVRIELMTF